MKKYSIATIVAIVFFLEITPVWAVDYVIRKTGEGDPYVTAPWGTWQGYIATPAGTMAPNNGMSSHTLEFEFQTPDYFRDDNSGHFAVAVRADGVSEITTGNGISDRLRGRGVILGSVQGYQNFNFPCWPSSKPSTVVLEDFWAGGNCVYGGGAYNGALEGPKLQNNKRYKIRVASYYYGGNRYVTQYTLWDWGQGGVIGRGSMVDDLNSSPFNLGGFFILEVFSKHNWTFNIYNLVDYWQPAPALETCANKVPIYTSQFSQPGKHDRYMTTSPAEHRFVLKSGYTDANLITAYLEPTQKSNTTRFRRFYNPAWQNHIATHSSSDISYLLSNGWIDDGYVGYIYTSQTAGTIPLYRLWKNHNGLYDVEHRYTTSLLEVNSLQGQGWGDDGVYGYVCP